jgi:hypothetical protein
MKDDFDGLSSRLERIPELKDVTIQTSELKSKEERGLKK